MRLRLRPVLLAGALAAGLAVLALRVWVALPLPPELAAPGGVPSLVLEDRHGLTLRTTRAADGSRGGWVSLEEVAPTVLQAFLAAEDHRFFEHRGVDLRAVARAARDNLRARRVVSGASTITMQAARLLRPAPRTWRGKLSQLLWALRLEAHREKGWILEQYLNRVPLGQGAVGVAAGGALYFDADPRSLSLGQAALLAALAHAPSRDNPLVNAERARIQRGRVLERMAALGYAPAEELARATTEPVLRRGASNSFLAPHFTTRLLLDRTASAPGTAGLDRTGRLDRVTGSTRTTSHSDALPATGTWRTTLDLDLQRALEAEVRHSIELLRDRNARHAALVVLDNPTGEILAWVGSPDFWAEAAGQVDMVVSPRQPGSALKPFLFGLAFDRGYTAATVLPDIPSTYQTATGPYQPRNYDRRFRGPVRARVALASSFNVPAVELAVRLGPGALLNTLHAAGFVSLTRTAEHYGPGLALGNGDVTLLELANGFRGLANGGVWTPVRGLAGEGGGGAGFGREGFGHEGFGREGFGREGEGLEGEGLTGTGLTGEGFEGSRFGHGELGGEGIKDQETEGKRHVGGTDGAPRLRTSRRHSSAPIERRRFLSPGAATLVLDILSDPIARIPGFGTETPFDLPFPAAAKTGTSRHFTDNWAVVTTSRFTLAVWVGNFSGRPMQGVSGITGAGPLAYRAALEVARRYPPGYLPTPAEAGAATAPVCILSGLRATPECPAMIEWFLPGTEPTIVDSWQRDGRTILPPEYAEWAAAGDREARLALGVGSALEAGPALQVSGSAREASERVAGGEYREARINGDGGSAFVAPDAAARATASTASGAHRILSPLDGDIYEIPVAIASRYATIPLIATGDGADNGRGSGGERGGERGGGIVGRATGGDAGRAGDTGTGEVSWYVNGRPVHNNRWQLMPGAHVITAIWRNGARDSVRIEVR